MARKDLLNEEGNDQNTRHDLLGNDGGEESTLTDAQRKKAIANFYTSLAQSDNKIMEVVAYPIDDRDPRIKIKTLRAFTVNKYEVSSVDFKSMPDAVKINDQFYIDLVPRGSRSPLKSQFFYNEEDAVEYAAKMNLEQYALVQEEKAKYDAAFEYMTNLIEGNRL